MSYLTGLGYLVALAVIVSNLVFLGRGRVSRAWSWFLVIAVVALTLGRCYVLFEKGIAGGDYYAFFDSGLDVWEGRDPYAPNTRVMVDPPPKAVNGNVALNPPNTLPLFALFALMPFEAGYCLWVATNIVLAVVLVVLSARVLAAESDAPIASAESTPLPLWIATALSSWSFFVCMINGQITTLVAAAVAAAIWARRKHPVWAGLFLTIASFKPNTLVPFLMLFLRRRDLLAWVVAAVAGIALILAASSPGEIPGRLRSLSDRIVEYGSPGRINDPTFENFNSASMLGIDRMLVCLGVTNLQWAKVVQAVVLIATGLLLFRDVVVRRTLDGPAASALIALYSVVFLYHRLSDAVLLIFPFTYAAHRARVVEGTARVLYSLSALVILITLFVPGSFLDALNRPISQGSVIGLAARMLVLPVATYGVISAFVLLWVAEHRPAGKSAIEVSTPGAAI
jgi:Glycosyltransferase family 87